MNTLNKLIQLLINNNKTVLRIKYYINTIPHVASNRVQWVLYWSWRQRGTKSLRDALIKKNPFGSCHINHHRLRTATLDASPPNMPPTLNRTTGSTSRTKGSGGKATTQCHQTPIRTSAAPSVTWPAYPASSLSATNVILVGVDYLLDLYSRSQTMMMNMHFLIFLIIFHTHWKTIFGIVFQKYDYR